MSSAVDDGRDAIMDEHQNEWHNHVELAADIVSAYVSNNPVPASELGNLILEVHQALKSLAEGPAEKPAEPQAPAVPIKRSVTPEYLICLEDGKKFKSLKRHLSAVHGMTPQQYREKWNLPHDYPMTAPEYSSARSALAKKSGLGRKQAEQPEPVAAPVKRGRKPKAA